MKKFLAFICMSVFLLESTYNVYATEPNVVISEVIYDEVIDVDELIQLGIEQYRGKPMTRSDTENMQMGKKNVPFVSVKLQLWIRMGNS